MLEFLRRLLMKDVLTTNQPDLIDLYVKGVITIDFRTRFSPFVVGRKCYLYASSPVKKVLAEATIQEVLKVTKVDNGLWTPDYCDRVNKLLTNEWDKKFFQYHIDVSDGYLIKFKDVKKYNTPLELSDFSVKRAPMSWCYV